MFNLLDKIKEDPKFYKQLSISEQLIAKYDCPLTTKTSTVWTEVSYFVYVVEGTKIWHVPGKSFTLTQGQCIFVKKGAHILEQFLDARFCLMIFFITDNFITDTVRKIGTPIVLQPTSVDQSVIAGVDADDTLKAFFNSVAAYFLNDRETNTELWELKFRELILNVINNPSNHGVTEYFYSLLTINFSEKIRMILEENFQYNLSIEDYARLCGRSLSAFKRDFETYFKTTPGRWLLERRLKQAKLLIETSNKSISEITFESGFENTTHFSRSFKQQFGSSPLNHRQKSKSTL
jgi:AraC-like DNA-binding protein